MIRSVWYYKMEGRDAGRGLFCSHGPDMTGKQRWEEHRGPRQMQSRLFFLSRMDPLCRYGHFGPVVP